MNRDFFARNSTLSETYQKAILKNQLIEEWERSEVLDSFLPAGSFRDRKGAKETGRTPMIFSLSSIIILGAMVATIIPIVVFGYWIVKMYLRRNEKLTKIQELQYEIQSTFPRVFDPQRDFLRTEKDKEMYEVLKEEKVIIHCSCNIREKIYSEEVFLKDEKKLLQSSNISN